MERITKNTDIALTISDKLLSGNVEPKEMALVITTIVRLAQKADALDTTLKFIEEELEEKKELLLKNQYNVEDTKEHYKARESIDTLNRYNALIYALMNSGE